MKDLHPIHSSAPAERWAAPKPACIPRVTKGPLVARGDRPTYATDEGLQ